MNLNPIDSKKNKKIRDFRFFVLSPIPKNENSETTEILQKAIILKYENIASKTAEMFFKSHKSQYDSAKFPIRYQVFVF